MLLRCLDLLSDVEDQAVADQTITLAYREGKLSCRAGSKQSDELGIDYSHCELHTALAYLDLLINGHPQHLGSMRTGMD